MYACCARQIVMDREINPKPLPFSSFEWYGSAVFCNGNFLCDYTHIISRHSYFKYDSDTWYGPL